MALLVVTSAYSQTTTRSKGRSILQGNPQYSEADPLRGANWEIFKFNNRKYHYFLGSDAVDNIVGEEHLLGHHWRGKDLDNETINDTIYLCNVETGEYLEIGGLWGENGLTSHVGLPYKIMTGTSTRRWGTLPDMADSVYWIQPLDVREGRVIGRGATGGGTTNHFEHNRYLFLRTQREYQGDNTGTASHPGGLLFKFRKYEVDGQTCYVIYTHRKTEGVTGNNAEFRNRDSYLLLTSVANTGTSDAKSVRLKKFAGEMYGENVITSNATITDKTDLSSTTYSNYIGNEAEHKWGTYSPSASAANTYTTTNTHVPTNAPGVTVSTDGDYMQAAYYPQNNSQAKYRYNMRFNLTDNNAHTVTISAPSGYVITGYTIHGIVNTVNNKCKVTMDDAIDEEDGTASETLVTSEIQIFKLSGISQRSTTLTIQAEKPGGSVLCFPEFYVTLAPEGNSDAYPLGDEVKFYENNVRVVAAEDALGDAASPHYVAGDKNNLWKIVTKKQRDRYRLVASEKKPVDVSSRIFNPNFNTSWVYNVLMSNATKPAGQDYYVGSGELPNYYWEWNSRSGSTPPATPHIHPWPTSQNDETTLAMSKEKEFHKIGTGRFWRFSERNESNNGYIGGHDNNMQEMNITRGVDADYCGSIFKGTANVRQTIGTGAEGDPKLREGNYIVYVHGFFAPHDMEKYQKDGEDVGGAYNFDGSPMGTASADWKAEALVGMDGNEPVWRRSHDSYLFAYSYPDGSLTRAATAEDVAAGLATAEGETIDNAFEVRRMLPSIYEGATPAANLGTMSKNQWLESGEYLYSPLHNKPQSEKNLIMDEHVFGYYHGNFFDANISGSYAVPRTVSGASRFFSTADKTAYPEAQNYRIGLPVYVGSNGLLTIGVDHTRVTGDEPYRSGDYEWVCFDNFELLYLGADEPDDFIIDEQEAQGTVPSYEYINGWSGQPWTEEGKTQLSEDGHYNNFYDDYIGKSSPGTALRRNNTQVEDLFSSDDINNFVDPNTSEDEILSYKAVKNVLIRRTMQKDEWNSIILPVPLSAAQVKAGFGEDAQWSKLETVQARTLVYKAVTDTMEAGQPYIIKPSKEPEISDKDTYLRPAHTDKVSNTSNGVAGLYFKAGTDYYYRNYEIDHELQGPIYVIEDVTISMKDVFPNAKATISGSSNLTSGAVQWPQPKSCDSEVQVRGMAGTFTLREFGNYENPDTDGSGSAALGVPPNSYYMNKGKLRYTSTGFSTTKGLFSYIQLWDNTNNEPYAKPFLDGDMYFEEYVEDISGIEDVNNRPDVDGQVKIYDLMGRKVSKVGKGLYIMNGRKVLFK